MPNKKYLIAGAVLVAIVLIVMVGSYATDDREDNEVATSTVETTAQKPSAPKIQSKNTGTADKAPSTLIKTNMAPSGFPEIEFIDKILSFALPNYERINVRVQKIAFGRGEAAASTGCKGIPNTNFSTYLYPGSGICISNDLINGVPRGILALHLIIENNGSYNFGGNAKVMQLHYLRASPGESATHRFAYPLNSLANYNIVPYTSKEVILSFLVPEDQKNFDLLFDYDGVPSLSLAQNVYADSKGGLFIDFSSKSLSHIK